MQLNIITVFHYIAAITDLLVLFCGLFSPSIVPFHRHPPGNEGARCCAPSPLGPRGLMGARRLPESTYLWSERPLRVSMLPLRPCSSSFFLSIVFPIFFTILRKSNCRRHCSWWLTLHWCQDAACCRNNRVWFADGWIFFLGYWEKIFHRHLQFSKNKTKQNKV